MRADSVYCGQTCRQAGFRLRRRRATAARFGAPLRFAYADPPYPGKARRCYGSEPSYAGEVDHGALIAMLARTYPDGWALSTGAYALRALLPLCPASAHVCPWVKPNGVSGKTNGLHNAWEPLIVVGGRQAPPGVRDWLRAKTAIRGGTLLGRKPLAFCAWLFDCLGMLPGDELVDLYPGTGIVGRAWAMLCADASPRAARHAYVSRAAAGHACAEPSPPAGRHASPVADASPTPASDASPGPELDASPLERGHASPATSGDASAIAPVLPRRPRPGGVLPRGVDEVLPAQLDASPLQATPERTN